TSDVEILSDYVDGLLFVIRAEQTPREAVIRAINYLNAEQILGIVLNATRARSENDKYYYYSYYRRYGFKEG
ncbi:MAG: hypothetical protein D6812_11790, partial [Deltaproteobacteria bacterium]